MICVTEPLCKNSRSLTKIGELVVINVTFDRTSSCFSTYVFIFLQEYTEKGILNDCITPSDALLQAVCGLEHLHSLHIGKF